MHEECKEYAEGIERPWHIKMQDSLRGDNKDRQAHVSLQHREYLIYRDKRPQAVVQAEYVEYHKREDAP